MLAFRVRVELSLACFGRKTKIERQVFHLTLILFFSYNSAMSWTLVRRLLGLALLAASLIGLAWGLWPVSHQERSLVISPAQMRPALLPDAPPAIAGPRTLNIEWPPRVRAGETASIRLIFAPSSQPGQLAPAVSEMSGAYSVLAEARLELPGVPHAPLGQVSQALLPDRSLTFVWDLQPLLAGQPQGTLWLHLRFIPSAAGPELRQVLTAQRLEVRVIDFFGLTGPWARALGSAGAVLGAALGLDGVARWLWRRQVITSGG